MAVNMVGKPPTLHAYKGTVVVKLVALNVWSDICYHLDAIHPFFFPPFGDFHISDGITRDLKELQKMSFFSFLTAHSIIACFHVKPDKATILINLPMFFNKPDISILKPKGQLKPQMFSAVISRNICNFACLVRLSSFSGHMDRSLLCPTSHVSAHPFLWLPCLHRTSYDRAVLDTPIDTRL